MSIPRRGRIYSVGYEGTTPEELVGLLAQYRVSLLVDVRLQPYSRRPGFSRRPLAVTMALAGIEYVHEPLFGNPAENREPYRQGDPAAVKVMRDRLQRHAGDALEKLVEEARHRPVAVLCVERDASRCHRELITDAVRGLAPELEVVDVRADELVTRPPA